MTWKEWVLFSISSLAFMMSAITWIQKFIESRKSLTMKAHAYDKRFKWHLVKVTIENRSNAPITITSISVNTPTGKLPCLVDSRRHASTTRQNGNVVEYHIDHMSMAFPIQLGPLGATLGVLIFDDVEQAIEPSSKLWSLTLSTTRGGLDTLLSIDVPLLKAR